MILTTLFFVVVAADPACFRGWTLGKAYDYRFTTALSFEKKQLAGNTVERRHARNMHCEFGVSVIPMAESNDTLHLKMEISDAHIEDLEGWQAYDGYGDAGALDSTAADAQLLEKLQNFPFYFSQKCDFSVEDLHYPVEEEKFAVNMKHQLVSAFAHRVKEEANYEHLQGDQFGEKVVRVSRDGDVITSVADQPRPIPMRVKRQQGGSDADAAHIVAMDEDERVEAGFKDGIVHSYTRRQVHAFPGQSTRDEMAADAERAANNPLGKNPKGETLEDAFETHTDARREADSRYAAAAAGIEIHASAETSAKLTGTRSHRLRAADPQQVESFRAFTDVVHGDLAFTTRRLSAGILHLMDHKDIGTASPNADLAERLYMASDEDKDLGQLLHELNAPGGQFSWRALLHRLKVADADMMAVLRASIDDALPGSSLDESDPVSSGEADVPLPSDAMPHVLSLLGEVGGVEAEALLLRAAMRSPDRSPTRHQALLALAGIREPATETIDALTEHVRKCTCETELCVQLVLTLGAMGNELHHAGEMQRAHDIRELLFVRAAALRDTRECGGVFALALNNTMYQVDPDAAMFDVEVGRWLSQEDGKVARGVWERFDRQFADMETNATRKRAADPAPTLSLSGVLGGGSTSGWKKWYEGWSFSSRKNERLPNGGFDQAGNNWGLPSDEPGEPQYGLNGLGVDGKARSKGLLERCTGTYKDGTPCSSKHYDNFAPANPDQGWTKKLGSGKFYAMIEAALHKRAEGYKNRGDFFYELDFFAGAQFSGSLMGKKVPILSGYARANVSITNERDKCNVFDIGVFYFYFGKMFFWGIGTNDCQFVDSTCKPWFPSDRTQQGYLQFAHEVFFEMSFSFALGPIPMVVFIEGVGGAGMYWSVDMIYAPALKDKYGNECGGIDDGGGGMVNGFCEPEAYISLAAELGIGIPVLSAGIGVQVELLRVSLPASAGLNFVTQRPCFGIGVSVGALGGKIYLWARIGLCKGWIKICLKLKKTIYSWNGLSWEKPILRRDCCKPCPGSCNNAWCDYKHGKCVCNDGWGGELCNMECPIGCLDIMNINPRVDCVVNSDENAHGEICDCKEGYYGWNCLIPCPGLRPGDPEPKTICSGHGVCTAFGYEASTGFGVDNSVENTLAAHCACQDNWFGDRCDITCPADPETGRVCGGGGGVCAFDGRRAFCQCLKGYAGPECQARCPLFRGSPCGFRGDCVWEQGRAKCHCHIGFSGEGCEVIDETGGGRALKFDLTRKYYAEVPDAVQLRAPDNVYTVSLWFKPRDILPDKEATLLTWRYGRLLLKPPGTVTNKRAVTTAELVYCDGRSVRGGEGCLSSPVPVAIGENAEWQFVFASTASFQLAHDKQMWHGVPRDTPGQGCEVQPAPYDAWCIAAVDNHENTDFSPVKGSFRLGMNFTGAIDNVFVYGDRPTTRQVNERAHHVPEPDADELLFGALMDEGRGDTFYDERSLMAGQYVFFDGSEFDELTAEPDQLWENPSGVTLLTGAIYSNMTDAFVVGNGTEQEILFHLNLGGAKVDKAHIRFRWSVNQEALCPLTVTMLGDTEIDLPLTDENGRQKLYTGSSSEVIVLTPAQLRALRPITSFRFKAGVDAVPGGGECGIEIDEAYVECDVPVVDPMLEFTGRPSAFAQTTQHRALKYPFTIEMWLYRPELIRSNRGLLLALTEGGPETAKLASVDGPFLLYETGFQRLGLQYQMVGKTEKVLAGGHDQPGRYVVPAGEWVHFAVTVQNSPTAGKCLHEFTINGQIGKVRGAGSRDGHGERLDYPGPLNLLQRMMDKPNHCVPGGAMAGWGDPRFTLRVGSKFLGAINDVRIHNRALTTAELLSAMMVRTRTLPPSAVHVWTFDGVQRGGAKNEPVILPDSVGGAALEMLDGSHLGLVEAVERDWRHCPGVSYQFPESICASDPTKAHGKCVRPGRVRVEERGVDTNERERAYECKCYDGYKPGIMGDCSVECPGGHSNACSGHGQCVGSVAPIEAWENPDGTENTTYTGEDENTHNRVQGADSSCVCDEGYVGPACEYECPGWSEPWNRPQRECSGYGHCNYTVAGGPTCTCFDSVQRYGDSCQNAYGSSPDEIITDCGACQDLGEVCVDGFCGCENGFHRVFGVCREHGAEFDISDNTGVSVGVFVGVLLCFCCTLGLIAVFYVLKLKD